MKLFLGKAVARIAFGPSTRSLWATNSCSTCRVRRNSQHVITCPQKRRACGSHLAVDDHAGWVELLKICFTSKSSQRCAAKLVFQEPSVVASLTRISMLTERRSRSSDQKRLTKSERMKTEYSKFTTYHPASTS